MAKVGQIEPSDQEKKQRLKYPIGNDTFRQCE